MTLQEEKKQMRQEQRAKWKTFSGKQKLQYFRDYYLKTAVFLVVLLFVLAGLCRDLWRGSRESIFYALVVNNYSPVPDEFREGFLSYANLDSQKYNITIDSTMKINVNQPDDMSKTYMQEIIAISSTRKQDIFLADGQIIDYYWNTGYIEDLREALPEEFLKQYEDKFYYLPDADGAEVPVGISVADSPVLAEYGMFENQQPIVSVVYLASNTENIQAFLSYLYKVDYNLKELLF